MPFPSMSKRARTLETSANPNQLYEDDQTQTPNNETPKICVYEQSREERIKENLERMQKLGILDLSLKLKSVKPPTRKTPHRLSPLPPSGPVRRSSRLQNVTPMSYSEVHLAKDPSLESDIELLREGSKPEVYTEEHEKLLGDTNMSWTFFVDGYGKDGKRIYDPIKGKTCHQCRQKTLGHRTKCCKCNMVQGQFCGDCLYMRYGENVLEAKQNPNWICPVCRGICNCSLCRQAKGWPATGVLYKRISNMGFKSVAHYLIQTKRSNADLENTKKPVMSAKRSLPFSEMEAGTPQKNDSSDSKDLLQGLEKPEAEDNKTNDDFKAEKGEEEGVQFPDKQHGDNQEFENKETEDEFKVEKEEDEITQLLDDKACESNVAVETNVESKIATLTPIATKPMLVDNIGGRSRQRHGHDKQQVDLLNEASPPNVDSIAGRLRLRRKKK